MRQIKVQDYLFTILQQIDSYEKQIFKIKKETYNFNFLQKLFSTKQDTIIEVKNEPSSTCIGYSFSTKLFKDIIVKEEDSCYIIEFLNNIVLSPEQKADKNAANIDYIAIMTGIDLQEL